jgi:hypothetical protein
MEGYPIENQFFRTLYDALIFLEGEGVYTNTLLCIDGGTIQIATTCLPTVGQFPVQDVRREERVVFQQMPGGIIPMPYFLREDFPSVPHLLRNTGLDKFPCIYTAHEEQLALQWDAQAHAYNLYNWLNQVADGTLHEGNVPLEDVVQLNQGHLILPVGFLLAPDSFTSVSKKDGGKKMIYQLGKDVANGSNDYLIKHFKITDIPHSGVLASPATLDGLQILIDRGISDFSLSQFLSSQLKTTDSLHKKLLLIVEAEIVDEILSLTETRYYGFATEASIQEIGVAAGLLYHDPEGTGYAPILASLLNFDLSRFGDVLLTGLMVHVNFSLLLARESNGHALLSKVGSVVQVGVGALGSQVARNLAQSGLADEWFAIDNDILLPHNLSRFVLAPNRIGENKAHIVCSELNDLVKRDNYAVPMVEKVAFGALDAALRNSVLEVNCLVLDTSASISVQRTLDKDIGNNAVRATAFLSPDGKSLTFWFTPKGADVSHSMLEAHYYSWLINNEIYKNLLHVEDPGFTYSGDSCRSISFVLSTHHVSLFSALTSQAVQSCSELDVAYSSTWVIKDSLDMERISLPVTPFLACGDHEETKVFISPHLLQSLYQCRTAALPNETGGVLIGMYDAITGSIYLTDQITAPLGSTSSAGHFHRGMDGVEDTLLQIKETTHNNLMYLGEWHSHPENILPVPSEVDLGQLAWLRKQAELMTHPYLMIIVGDDDYTISI